MKEIISKRDNVINPIVEKLDAHAFTENKNLGLDTLVAVIVKDQNRLLRARRLIDAQEEKKEFSGRSEAHDLQAGFIYVTRLASSLQIPDKKIAYLELPEPRNIAKIGNSIIVTAGDGLHVFTSALKETGVIKNPYFGYLHSARVNRDGTKFIVSSTGFDSIIEFDSLTHRELWRWTAWDHGYNDAANGSFITENALLAQKMKNAGKDVLLVDESVKQSGHGLPTSYRTTHVNDVMYDYDENYLLATFFHSGKIVRINRKTGESKTVMDGMSHPHAVEKYKGGYIITDTSHGLWYQMDKNFQIQTRVDFRGFPGKTEGMGAIEWIQSVVPLTKTLFIAVDANRQAAWIFDPIRKEYSKIQTKPEWAVQEIISVDSDFIAPLKKRI